MKTSMNKILLWVFGLVISVSFQVTAQKQKLVVAQDGSGDYRNVQEALSTIPRQNQQRITIYIKKGIYKEKLRLDSTQNNVTLVGEDVQKTILTFDDYSGKMSPSGQPFRTFSSSTFTIKSNDFRAENLTFENSAGPVGQAVAVYAPGDRMVFFNCHFLGNQDTLYVGMPGEYGRHYYKDCYIEGTIDFIFGSSTAVFENCTIFSKIGCNYITAASTPKDQNWGLVFLNCRLTGDMPEKSVYLGRPWRDFARTHFIHCFMDKHIKPEGWHNWDKPQAESTVTYGEYRSYGTGSSKKNRVKWSHQLKDNQAKLYRPQEILQGNDQWNPLIFEK